MERKYKIGGSIGAILLLLVSGVTLYMNDYREILNEFPNQDLFLLDNVSGKRIEMLARSTNPDIEFYRWRYEEDKQKFYHARDLKTTSYWQVFEGSTGVFFNEKDVPKTVLNLEQNKAQVRYEIDYFADSRHTEKKGTLVRLIDVDPNKNKETIYWTPADDGRYNFKWITVLDDYEGETQKITDCFFKDQGVEINWCDSTADLTSAWIYKSSKRLVVRYKSGEGYREIDPYIASGSQNISVNYSASINMTFILTSANQTGAEPIGQNSSIGAINITNNEAVNNITLQLRVNYTNNPYKTFLVDDGFEYNWTVNVTEAVNSTYNWTIQCASFQPSLLTNTSSDFVGRFRYTFNTFLEREWVNSSNTSQVIKYNTTFNCPDSHNVRYFKENISIGGFTNLSIDFLDDNSSNNITFYFNATKQVSYVMNTSTWRTATLSGLTFSSRDNLTFEINITELSDLNTSLSQVYFRDFKLFNGTQASSYYTIKINDEYNYSTAQTLTETFTNVTNITAGNQKFVWMWLDANFPPLGLDFDVDANASICTGVCS